MDKTLTIEEAVKRRKSTRSYDMSELPKEELARIMDYAEGIPLLFPESPIKAEIIGPDDIKAMMKWRAPHYFALYSDGTDKGLMNLGFVYEQVVLHLTTQEIGTCWATSISPKVPTEENGMKWGAVIAFGRPVDGDFLREPGSAKRKNANDIYDREGEILEAARLAPSSMNNQPWRFEHNGDSILVFCKKQGLLKKWMVSQNKIDMGIALGNIKAVTNGFRFKEAGEAVVKNGYVLVGTIDFER